GPLSNKSLEVLGSTSTDILWILYPFEEGIGGSKILSLGGYSMLSRNIPTGVTKGRLLNQKIAFLLSFSCTLHPMPGPFLHFA
ncbi:hypothetical protein, partial [Parasutterella excrementihominis]|uniref:hypothetical protein n=1 Tax=Parasutterella excrementihominis TaxID=487175 RepID=UPI003A90C594